MSGSEVADLHRCPWRWHLRHVRKLARREGEAKPGTIWGTCYHAAIGVLLAERCLRESPEVRGNFHRGPHHADAALAAMAERGIQTTDGLAWRGTERLAADVAEQATAAAEAVDAWLAAAGWRVAVVPLGPGGAPVPGVERRLSVDLPELGVGIDGRVDALLTDPQGRLAWVDHKTVDRWPERGEHLRRDEVAGPGVDLRDDLQARVYDVALNALGLRPARWLHLMRRATTPRPPPISYADKPAHKLHGPSRAKDVETTPELYAAAVAACGKDPAEYAVEIDRAALTRWQAWASVDLHPEARRRTLPILVDAAARAASYLDRDAADVPRHHVAGRHPGSCARCPDRELCVAEERGLTLDAELEIVGRYGPAPDRYPDETHLEGDPDV